MASGTTRTLNRYMVGGYLFEKDKATPLPVEDALAFLDNDRLKITISGADRLDPTIVASGPHKPKEKADRIVAIREAIDSLEPDDETAWTSDGLPNAAVLTKVLGWQVTSEERDMAFGHRGAKPKSKGIKIVQKPIKEAPAAVVVEERQVEVV